LALRAKRNAVQLTGQGGSLADSGTIADENQEGGLECVFGQVFIVKSTAANTRNLMRTPITTQDKVFGFCQITLKISCHLAFLWERMKVISPYEMRI